MTYQANQTLPYRVELYRQLKRKRTAFAYGFVLSLPILVAIAVKFGPSGNSGGPTRLGSGTTDLIGLATLGAANFTTTMLYFSTPFLLVTVIALFNGDTVASEASWSTLRYLLASPVPRTRLLIQKIKVSLTLSLIAVLLVPLSAWIVGTIAFGLKPLQTPLGATFDNATALSRIAIMTGYLAISLLFVAGLAFYLSVRTDAPLGAVGVAVGISILLNILDAITALGVVREWLPVHYAFSWFDALSITIDWSQMIRGASYCAMAGILFYALAIMKFAKKDVTS
ncbi:NosY ABC-type transport system involved in multi-copper enzyme maturation, permease component [Candidatus Nanopelagicaceae bacterium]|jgi:ABC-2 type transport system permease protein